MLVQQKFINCRCFDYSVVVFFMLAMNSTSQLRESLNNHVSARLEKQEPINTTLLGKETFYICLTDTCREAVKQTLPSLNAGQQELCNCKGQGVILQNLVLETLFHARASEYVMLLAQTINQVMD